MEFHKTNKNGYASDIWIHEGSFYCYHSDCREAYKKIRELLKEQHGKFLSVKNIGRNTFKNKNGKYMFRVRIEETANTN